MRVTVLYSAKHAESLLGNPTHDLPNHIITENVKVWACAIVGFSSPDRRVAEKTKADAICAGLVMVSPERFERSTHGLKGRCSTD